MDLITGLVGATDLNLIGKFIYNVLFGWVQTWSDSWNLVGAFAVTVILFTVILKIVTSPLDLWTKNISRKNQKKMLVMKPELDKITKQCGDNKELLMQKQRALYKKHKYHQFGACLPQLVVMVLFIVIFTGFNSAVRYHNSVTYEKLSAVYSAGLDSDEARDAGQAAYDKAIAEGKTAIEATNLKEEAKIVIAENAVLNAYEPDRFFLTVNIFTPDNWSNPIPSAGDFSGTGIGKLGIPNIDATDYNQVMRPLYEKYNTRWNGYLILPILALLLNILSTKLMKPADQPQVAGQTEAQMKQQQQQMKMMQYMMPIIMVVFALFYSAAFTLYMVMNSLLTTVFNISYNLITKRIDKKAIDRYEATTIKTKK